MTDEIARLTARLERERAARLEAEAIAERGIRDLWHANQDLDRRVEQRTADLLAAQADAEAGRRAKTEFLATLSHEMRTPLAGVLGMLELLKSNVKGEQATTYLRNAIESASRLDRLFARLLDLVDLDAGSIAIEPVDVRVSDLVEDFAARWRRDAMAAGVLFSAESHFARDATIAVDTHRMRQIVDELIDNALRHGHASRVEVRLRPIDDGIVRVEVVDDGAGIPADSVEDLFVTFAQLDSGTTRVAEGAGLGLALSRQLARAMRGEVTIEPRVDGGTVGLFWLGAAEADDTQA